MPEEPSITVALKSNVMPTSVRLPVKLLTPVKVRITPLTTAPGPVIVPDRAVPPNDEALLRMLPKSWLPAPEPVVLR